MMVRVKRADELALVLRVAGVVVKELPTRKIDEKREINQENGTA